ncbi:branched-chain amino acid ABC transporter ATP-binding protein/permease [Paralcaligenes sp. KSB-10]|uniref:branched-chain amino acid ABC transporter ATP-binding protein/permease n=1 Tax=Paralcaligenes sp. KSB-10 TaxID=2901142 RepID=UPI001E2F004E|nr:branched-chain amino acid ABC transporter ATP-binding protein/permease [Paralcaligenes sp. KSB-10]UHL63975.1 branched-chain amino acid ABC transporter ATP-binding protein/permease [Paralcaligenes sp. KSB-10]
MKASTLLRNNTIIVGAGLALYLIGALLLKNSYYQLIFTLVPIWAMMGVAWNIISGYSGLVSFGHASFFGLGAFAVTLLFVHMGITPWLGLIGAGAIGALAGLLIGIPTFRLRGLYFALAMLAYPLVLLYVFDWLGLNEITLPMQRVDPWKYMQFSDQRVYIVIGVVLLAGSLLVNLWVARSRFGLSLLAIKQNELAAQAAGINPFVWKLKALVLSGAIAGVAGGFYAVVMLIVTPASVFGMLVSAEAMIVTLFGGAANIAGPLVGAVVLIPLGEILNAEFGNRWPGIQGVVYGLAIILVILIAPQGILPKLAHAFRRKRNGPARAPNAFHAEPYMRKVQACTGTPMSDVLLAVRNLSKSFGGVVAVSEVSFDVYRGEILGIIGPNGAGKTTLFNVLNGVLSPTQGQVSFEGKSLERLPLHGICRAGIGRTFQVVRLFPRLSLLDNIVVGAFSAHRKDAAAYDAARTALVRVGLASHEDEVATSLTTLQLRLMELARSIVSRPRLLLLDEILAGLGSEEVEHVLKVIDDLRNSGITIVIIEHTMQAMVRLADRLLVLNHGRMLICGKPALVTSDPKVIEAYLGKRWATHAAH